MQKKPLAGKGSKEVENDGKTVHMYINAKNDTCLNYSRNGGVSETGGGGEFKYDIFDTL
jgi:hypothetical protein